VDVITEFLDKYGYVSRSEEEEEGRRTYFLSELEDVLGVFRNPKNKIHLRSFTLSIHLSVPAKTLCTKSDSSVEKKSEIPSPEIVPSFEIGDADSTLESSPNMGCSIDSFSGLLKLMLTFAMDKAFHMIRSQRCTNVTAVEWTNTFNLSTVKTEESPPCGHTINLSVFLMNSSCEVKNLGLEQWRISFIPVTPDYCVTLTNSHVTPEVAFKKICVLFRSLESLLCFLPCYPLVKHSRKLQYESTFQCTPQENDPSQFGSACRDFVFKKIVTPVGEFCLSVLYRSVCPLSILKTKDLTSYILEKSYGEGSEENVAS